MLQIKGPIGNIKEWSNEVAYTMSAHIYVSCLHLKKKKA